MPGHLDMVADHMSTKNRTHRAGRPTILLYRDKFLAPSETFIRDHLAHLRRYDWLVAAENLLPGGLDVASGKAHVLGQARGVSRAHPAVLRRVGVGPEGVKAAQIGGLVRSLRPALVHAHFGPEGAIAQRGMSRSGVPLVVTFHGWDASVRPEVMRSYGGPAAHMIAHWTSFMDRADAIIAVSEAIKSELLSRGAPARKIAVIPCGVDTSRFPVAQPRPDGPILFVGRLVEKKGCGDLIEALAGVPHAPPLLVLGEGPLRGELEQQAADLRVDVEFRGVCTPTEVRAAMASSRFVVMPSRRADTGDIEGLPVVALEAGATGRPVIGYRHSGMPSAVVDGRTGLLVREGDVVALARALSSATGGEVDLPAMGRAARAHVVSNFEQSRLVDTIETLYDDVRTTRGQRVHRHTTEQAR